MSPPKAGKTTILKQLVYSVERNNPEVHLMVLLVDERPEEVTDMRRHVPRGEVGEHVRPSRRRAHTHIRSLMTKNAERLTRKVKGRRIVGAVWTSERTAD